MTSTTVSPFADAFADLGVDEIEVTTTTALTLSVELTEADRAGFAKAAGVFDGNANTTFVRMRRPDLDSAESFAAKLAYWAGENKRSSTVRSDDPRWTVKAHAKAVRKATRVAKAATDAVLIKGTPEAIEASVAAKDAAVTALANAVQAFNAMTAQADAATGPVVIAVRIAKVSKPRAPKSAVDTDTVTETQGEPTVTTPADLTDRTVPTPGLAAGTSPVSTPQPAAPKPGPRRTK